MPSILSLVGVAFGCVITVLFALGRLAAVLDFLEDLATLLVAIHAIVLFSVFAIAHLDFSDRTIPYRSLKSADIISAFQVEAARRAAMPHDEVITNTLSQPKQQPQKEFVYDVRKMMARFAEEVNRITVRPRYLFPGCQLAPRLPSIPEVPTPHRNTGIDPSFSLIAYEAWRQAAQQALAVQEAQLAFNVQQPPVNPQLAPVAQPAPCDFFVSGFQNSGLANYTPAAPILYQQVSYPVAMDMDDPPLEGFVIYGDNGGLMDLDDQDPTPAITFPPPPTVSVSPTIVPSLPVPTLVVPVFAPVVSSPVAAPTSTFSAAPSSASAPAVTTFSFSAPTPASALLATEPAASTASSSSKPKSSKSGAYGVFKPRAQFDNIAEVRKIIDDLFKFSYQRFSVRQETNVKLVCDGFDRCKLNTEKRAVKWLKSIPADQSLFHDEAVKFAKSALLYGFQSDISKPPGGEEAVKASTRKNTLKLVISHAKDHHDMELPSLMLNQLPST
ncbi:hypothetical protein B0H66DRAFT_636620 [Apodospora peruviana]|uniref:Uncharacterized protein n=1 Tax=Apodospora peruviana TaxID=516989 RepID=A0AAE0MAA0_9PEZI|nr:hypothetical protein B0H66DRAFT_636620 [Apodospora peruviana]